jgi:uncharacterized membrane protein
MLLAIGLGGLGVLSLRYRDFALNWQPVPDWVPMRALLGSLSGAVLAIGGLGLLWKRTAGWAARAMTIFVLSWLVLLQVPRVAGAPLNAGVWLGFAENLLLVTGAWTLALLLSGGTPERPQRAARLLYGLALPLIGLSHFVYLDFTAAMVPAWLPAHGFFAVLTGTGHIAAGLGLLCGVVPRLAATLEAAMIGAFVLLLHLPGVLQAPGDRLQWTMLCIAMAYDGAAWAVAASLVKERWGSGPWSRADHAASSAVAGS